MQFDSEYIELDLPKEIASGNAKLRKSTKTGISIYEFKLDVPFGNRVFPTKIAIPEKHIHSVISIKINPKSAHVALF